MIQHLYGQSYRDSRPNFEAENDKNIEHGDSDSDSEGEEEYEEGDEEVGEGDGDGDVESEEEEEGDDDNDDDDDPRARLNLQVYVAANKYMIPSLAECAKDEFEAWSAIWKRTKAWERVVEEIWGGNEYSGLYSAIGIK